jgi:hypothetical protein
MAVGAMKPTQRIVEILWDDAHQQADQCSIEDLQEECYVCTLGYVVRESPRSLWISSELLDTGDVRGSTRIPKGMIVEIRELRRTRPRKRQRIGESP